MVLFCTFKNLGKRSRCWFVTSRRRPQFGSNIGIFIGPTDVAITLNIPPGTSGRLRLRGHLKNSNRGNISWI